MLRALPYAPLSEDAPQGRQPIDGARADCAIGADVRLAEDAATLDQHDGALASLPHFEDRTRRKGWARAAAWALLVVFAVLVHEHADDAATTSVLSFLAVPTALLVVLGAGLVVELFLRHHIRLDPRVLVVEDALRKTVVSLPSIRSFRRHEGGRRALVVTYAIDGGSSNLTVRTERTEELHQALLALCRAPNRPYRVKGDLHYTADITVRRP